MRISAKVTLPYIFVFVLAAPVFGQAVSVQAPATTDAPLTITLQDALERARVNSVPFHAALTDHGVAHQDKVQARAALLPSVNFNNTATITQSNGAGSGVFLANNGPHEYLSQANVHEAFTFAGLSDLKRSAALEAVAKAKAEIAARGLVVTVVQSYYGLIASQRKYANTQQAATEAQRFLELSRKLEHGGEVAHSDVIKAQIQSQDRQRDLRESQLAMEKSRLDLAVLLFPNFTENFTVVDDLDLAPPLRSFDEIARAAQERNPGLQAATSFSRAARYELVSAWAGYLPSVTVDYFYGIDAPHFAVREPNGVNNLGYAASASVIVPIWNWGATHSKVVQADLKRKQAERELSFAQRKLLADIRSVYGEADAAHSELDLLKSSAELAAESLRLTTLRYQGGESTVLEVVDAQNTLTQARNAYDDGVVRYRTALANLQTLTGTM
jgi:outer membrane protein TolC